MLIQGFILLVIYVVDFMSNILLNNIVVLTKGKLSIIIFMNKSYIYLLLLVVIVASQKAS